MSGIVVVKNEWNSVQVGLKAFKDALVVESDVLLSRLSELYVEALRNHIKRQDLPFVPLKDNTVARKGSDKWYYHTGEFYRKLRVRKLRAGRRYKSYLAGALKNVKHRHSGLSMYDIAMILNYGTKKIPPRNLFGLTLEEFNYKYIIKRHWRYIQSAIIRKMRLKK